MTIDYLNTVEAERGARAKRLNAAGDRAAALAQDRARMFEHLTKFGGLAKFPTTGNALLRSSSRRGALAARLYHLAVATLVGAR